MNIKKGSIVWYWHDKENQWCKGKVVTVNKYNSCSSNSYAGLMVMHRKTKKLYHVPVSHTAYPASEPKPHLPIGDYLRWNALADRWSFINLHMSDSSAKLFRKLGIVPNGKAH